jgi:hypothetical protein
VTNEIEENSKPRAILLGWLPCKKLVGVSAVRTTRATATTNLLPGEVGEEELIHWPKRWIKLAAKRQADKAVSGIGSGKF